MNNNVVITGMGILSPIATGKDSFWKGLSQGKTGFREITLFNTDAYNVRLAGELA